MTFYNLKNTRIFLTIKKEKFAISRYLATKEGIIGCRGEKETTLNERNYLICVLAKSSHFMLYSIRCKW